MTSQKYSIFKLPLLSKILVVPLHMYRNNKNRRRLSHTCIGTPKIVGVIAECAWNIKKSQAIFATLTSLG